MKKNLLVATLIAMVCVFNSCGDSFENVNDVVNDNIGLGHKLGTAPDDSLTGYSFKDLRERFVGDAIEYSFIHVDVYEKSGSVPSKNRTSLIVDLTHFGVAPQYFNYVDTAFTTVKGQAVITDSIAAGEWQVRRVLTTQNFVATNADNDSICTSTTTGAAEVVYTYAGDSLHKGYEVIFDAPVYTLEEKTTMGHVTGLPYNGKTWAASKYDSKVSANFEIAEAYRMAGEPSYTKTLSVDNLAFLLKHEVNTSLEEMSYIGQFKAEGRDLSTVEEKVSGKIVTRDNGEVKDTVNFDLQMNLALALSQPEDILVNSEDELKDINFKHVLGTIAETSVNKGVFEITSATGKDTITLADNTKVVADFGFNRWAWGEKELASAKIAGRQVSITSEKNDELSTSSVMVYTVTVMMAVTVDFVGLGREAEIYNVQVSYNRSYQLPDDITTEVMQRAYNLDLKANGASALYADQYNQVQVIVKNRGELVSSLSYNYPLALNASIKGGDTVLVAQASKPQVIATEEHADQTGWTSTRDTAGFAVRFVKDAQTIRLSGGNVLKYEYGYEVLTKDGKDIYDHAEVAGNPAISFNEPVLVDSVVKNAKIEKIYRVDANVLPTITSTKNSQKAATRATGNNTNVNSLNLTTAVYQKVVINDEYVPGMDRIDTVITVNGNQVTWNVKLYETYSISGEVLKDQKSGTFQVTLEGTDGGEVTLNDTIVVTTGNGLTGCGAGNYTNNVNGSANWTNLFNYSAPAVEAIVLNGTNGTTTVNLPTSWVITEKGQKIGGKNAVAGYDKYNYSSYIKGDYTIAGEKVSLEAEATKTLKVSRNVNDVVKGKIQSVGFSFVPAHEVGENTGIFADGDGKQYATLCMCIVSDSVTAAIPFTGIIPTEEAISNANWVEGNYTAAYNSGWYDIISGKWMPAIAHDYTSGIGYETINDPDARFVRNSSLNQWNWANNYSTKCNAYTWDISNTGVLTVYNAGQVVLEIK